MTTATVTTAISTTSAAIVQPAFRPSAAPEYGSVPRTVAFADPRAASASPTGADEAVLASIRRSSQSLMDLMRERLHNLRQVRARLLDRDAQSAIDLLASTQDLSVAADVLGALNARSNFFTLDMCTRLMPLLAKLMQGSVDTHRIVAMQTLHILVESFGPLIAAARTSPAGAGIGVDLSREARMEKFDYCADGFARLHSLVAVLAAGDAGTVADAARRVVPSLQAFA